MVRPSIQLLFILSAIALGGCQRSNGLQPAGWSDSGAKSDPQQASLLERHATMLRDRMAGEDLDTLTRGWPRATELPGRPESWMRVSLRDPAGAAPGDLRYAAMVDRGDPYVYWIEVSSSARGLLEYRGPARIE